MKIQSSSVLLDGFHRQELLSKRTKSASVSQGDGSSSHGVRLSLTCKTQQQQKISTNSSVSQLNDYRYHQNSFAARQSTEAILNTTISVNRWHGALQESRQGQQIEISTVTQSEYKEQLSFEALGKVTTEDGRTIDFMLALDFNREISEEQSAFYSGQVQLVDPLMINLEGGPVQLSDQYFEFDLMANGKTQNINQTAKGSGYLVFDRNGDGVVNDGNELFGPTTGNGFDELRQYDSDGNGWIDANDEIYSQLGVMTFTEQGEAVFQTAEEAGLGALYLGSIGSNYTLLDDDGEVLGSIRQSGVALSEEGHTLLLQEVHLRYEMEQHSTLNQSKGSLTVTAAGQPMAPPLGIEMRSWVSDLMAEFSLEEEWGDDLNLGLYIADAPASFRSPTGLDLTPEDKDGKLALLRQAVETLKEMQASQQQRLQQNSPVATYRKFGA